MAVSLGIHELATARTSRGHVPDKWFLSLAGAVSLGFALAFFGMMFHWIQLEPGPPVQDLLWVGSYFGFSAICMLVLALRLRSLDRSQSDHWPALPPLGNPKPAH